MRPCTAPPGRPALPAGGTYWPPAPSSILPASLSLVSPYLSHLFILLLNSRRWRGSCACRETDGPGGLQRGVAASQGLRPAGLRWYGAALRVPPTLPTSALLWTPCTGCLGQD